MSECNRCEVSRHSLWDHCLWCRNKLDYEEGTLTKDAIKATNCWEEGEENE